VYVSAKSL